MGTCSGAAKRGSDLPGLKSVFCRKKKKMMMKCFKKKMGWLGSWANAGHFGSGLLMAWSVCVPCAKSSVSGEGQNGDVCQR
jgi:hypothetical protein